ncbi:GDSL-type esterase/lipase family protein [Stenotrophomonas sp. RG-453]|jgi:lysophospholipase L1-like esterase|uniref:GDSL-type esterase/lipase family protein n=1 Tax=Stenotrophomonas sp. RG-453 TaxID=2957502 RepID=UPI0029CA38EB|nr:GDSL-type esterase/lipase family protein [Stenotrophomonas sp. RG-453]MDX5517780.1 GDSL-type esterase/lipase family protein [Stenotrophomonas sp. RG-453]
MLRWITAFSLALATSAAALPAQAQVWVPAWTASPAPDRLDGTPEAPMQFANQTVRQDMRLASSARALRFRISNELGQAPLRIGSASAHLTGTATAARPVTFNGRGDVVVPVGAALLSDPVAITAPALADVSLTVYFPDATRPAVRRTALRIAEGRAATVGDAVKLAYRQNVVSAVLAERTRKPIVVVALGDSITEGATATRGSNGDWPALLSARVQQACPDQVVVVNAGISGNKVMDHGRSHSALARLDRDVIALPNVDRVILFEGINDIRHDGGTPPVPGRNAEDMVLGYRQIAERLHSNGIRPIAATITPFGGSDRYEPIAAATRTTLNAWMRGGRSGFDGLIDFDRILRDPANPENLPEDITRDHLHPNDEGYRRMADGIDLALLGCPVR